jgi:hypothetical protein
VNDQSISFVKIGDLINTVANIGSPKKFDIVDEQNDFDAAIMHLINEELIEAGADQDGILIYHKIAVGDGCCDPVNAGLNGLIGFVIAVIAKNVQRRIPVLNADGGDVILGLGGCIGGFALNDICDPFSQNDSSFREFI